MTETQFWWNWYVNIALALATFLVVLVALFGDWLRTKLFRPKLDLQLLSREGEKARIVIASVDQETGQTKTREEDARYYHIRVSNSKRWPAATQVQIHLLRVEEPGPDDQFRVTWAGDVPLRWRHQDIHPLARTIGHDADCDLCCVVKGKWLELTPLVAPLNLNAKHRGTTRMRILLQARAVEADSELLHIEVSWNGQWADGDKEMAGNMVVKELH